MDVLVLGMIFSKLFSSLESAGRSGGKITGSPVCPEFSSVTKRGEMNGSQYDAIERRRKAIKEVILENVESIAGQIALGSYTSDKYGERLFCSLKLIDELTDEKLGIIRRV